MRNDQRTARQKMGHARRTVQHLFLDWLDQIGLTLVQWSDSHGLRAGTVQSWVDSRQRAIPMQVALLIVRESRGAVPVAAWDRIAARARRRRPAAGPIGGSDSADTRRVVYPPGRVAGSTGGRNGGRGNRGR